MCNCTLTPEITVETFTDTNEEDLKKKIEKYINEKVDNAEGNKLIINIVTTTLKAAIS